VSFAGQFGPCAGRAGHDPAALALAGALSRLNGTPVPTLPGLQVADVLTGAHATIATLLALQARAVTGRGQRVDIGMSDACMPLNLVTMARNPDLSKLDKPGKWHPKGGVWECQDGEYICTTDMETLYWRRFCDVIGRPEFADMQHAIDRHPEMQQVLKEIFKSKPRDEWVAIFAEADTQAMPVLSLAEAVQHPHNRERGMVIEVPFGEETLLHVGAPFHLSETPARVRFPATLPGAHSEEVLAELGYDKAGVEEIRKAGAFDA
jgi:crotonobetainyl-CoA:carnitine CoA-transferase CaiB-like acyl-CoA transferase